MVDSRAPLPLGVNQLREHRHSLPPLSRRSLVEFGSWALFTLGDLVLSVALLVHLFERAARGEVRLWEPVACSAIGLAFLFVVGCYAMRVTTPRRASPRGAVPRG
ncbi:MAG: hypothetical protein M0004_10965 [Actinomycetota bacterium]|nr:hypothetical protein [Actinomycetota bacterium]